MKKVWLLPLLALAFTGCNDSDYPTSTGKGDAENVARNYLSVRLLTPVSGTRAEEEEDYDVNTNDYQNGEESENKINSVRFYFFDNEGDPALVRKLAAPEEDGDEYLSYIDWYPTSTGSDEGDDIPSQTVEKILTATLGINQPADANTPELILAVLNPTKEVLDLPGNPTLSTIQSQVNDYLTGLTDNNFVITNSVYVDKNSDMVTATPLAAENFCSTEDDAADNPVNIYVERVVARLDFAISDQMTEATGFDFPNVYELEKQYTVDGTEQSIYVRLLGWNVTAIPTTSRLVKKINSEWIDDLFGDSEPWNIYQLHRSFWAINPETVEYQYGSFGDPESEDNDITTAMGRALPTTTNPVTTIYLQENANPNSMPPAEEGAEPADPKNGAAPTNPSKLILAAQLVNENGEGIELVRWANRYYTADGALTAIANSLNLYQITSTTGGTEYTKITPDDLQFVSAQELYGVNEEEGGKLPDDVADYYVYVQLSDDAEDITWYNGNTSSATAYNNSTAVNNYILNIVNHLMYWQSGYTYYYMNIRHLGATGTPGYDGVVRNHLYKATVTSIAGLGTPVYDPDQVIIPEMPTYDDSMLSVIINILQWRIVSQNYDFTWP